MARLCTIPCDRGNSTDGGRLDGASTLESRVVARGVGSVRVLRAEVLGVAGNKSGKKLYATGGSTIDNFHRVWFNVTTLPSAKSDFVFLDDNGNGGTGVAGLAFLLDTDGTIEMWDDVTGLKIGGDSPAVSTATWYCLLYSTVNASGAVAAYLVPMGSARGAAFASGTLDPFNRVFTNIVLCLGNAVSDLGTDCTGSWDFDDIAVNSSAAGGTETGLPSEFAFDVEMMPEAAGTYAEGDTGPIGGGTALSALAEDPPDDATTYYILDADNDRVTLNLGAFTAYAPDYGTILLTETYRRSRNASASGASHRALIRSGATDATGTTNTGALISWRTNGVSGPRLGLVSYVDPNTGSAWTPPALDAVEAGCQATNALPDVWVTAVSLVVEYLPRPKPAWTREANVLLGGGTH